MANQKEASPKKQGEKKSKAEKSSGGLTEAATAIGSALGTLAAKTGVEALRPADLGAPSKAKKPAGRGKPVKKNKARLPRREKKAQKKAADRPA